MGVVGESLEAEAEEPVGMERSEGFWGGAAVDLESKGEGDE